MLSELQQKFFKKILGVAIKNLFKVGNLCQSFTTLGQDPESSSPSQTKKLNAQFDLHDAKNWEM